MKTEAKQWLEQAEQDLQTARILEQTGRFGPCAFYCQQAAEKVPKKQAQAVLVFAKGILP